MIFVRLYHLVNTVNKIDQTKLTKQTIGQHIDLILNKQTNSTSTNVKNISSKDYYSTFLKENL
ncbi:hypothetical protein DERP_011587 [Dermatophagoides pteronyssinus]|uniref:Uncharacterized protein n=1 Tax=Dermatophagoides pteronyssinus TaxID=6956 RepID=A0ABQ8JWU8_DERPT|nr:hypothetical protein DERP_011587 [Dermatophagoides pteronyssinus]